ncbi:MAG TPA: prepilin-type N-terminal cleavage/methylation domain-containing protein, partial [Tepidisphaeraceae bacterium]|nr:prepilin-type N-terminal cleavage/methylation domain-containing protein [Tepidisphaeraceae bacterium]
MKHPRRNGFTLLELILAMFITCLLAVALYESLWTAFKARDSAEAAVEPVRQLQIAMEMIGKTLQCALPMTSNSNNQMSMIGPF